MGPENNKTGNESATGTFVLRFSVVDLIRESQTVFSRRF